MSKTKRNSLKHTPLNELKRILEATENAAGYWSDSAILIRRAVARRIRARTRRANALEAAARRSAKA